MGVLRQCFNERTGNIMLPDPSGGPDIEITPEIEAGLRERHNGFYVSLGMDLGIQFSNMGDYLQASDALHARNWPFTPYQDIPTDIPDNITHAAVMTQMLTGYSALFMTQKAFMESSFRSDVGNTAYPYGYMQLTPDATREGIEQLMRLPSRDFILDLFPEMRGFTPDENGLRFGGDTELEESVLNTLREDPMASMLISAGYNIRYSQNFDVELRAGHGYLLHYLGPGNFPRLVEASAENPDGIAYEALNGGAESRVLDSTTNRAIFFSTDENGIETPRTFTELFEFLENEKNLYDHAIIKDSIVDFECFEILTGEDAMQRAAEVQRPEPVLTADLPLTQ